MNAVPRRIAVVGASAAGLAVAEGLRDEGYDGAITVIGEETRAFYDRPPLSKEFFDEAYDESRISLSLGASVEKLGLDLRLGVRADALDLQARKLSLHDSRDVAWDALVVATGVSPISLGGGGLTLRTVEDAIRISGRLRRARRVVVVGAGVLGCELAALAVTNGCAATLVDPTPAPMIDKLGPVVAGRLAALHQAHGVEAMFGSAVARVMGEEDGRQGIVLADGSVVEADLVLVAIGARPACQWLAGSGLDLRDGVRCNEFCEAAPNVFAAGDVCNWFNPAYDRHMRIEHRMNATEQGMAVAANVLGRRQPFAPIPFFWSDQYDVRIHVHGLAGSDAETEVLAGDLHSDRFVLGYRRGGRIEGVLGWNMPREARKMRALVCQPGA